jgi:hypothetical protein
VREYVTWKIILGLGSSSNSILVVCHLVLYLYKNIDKKIFRVLVCNVCNVLWKINILIQIDTCHKQFLKLKTWHELTQPRVL